MVWLGVCGEDLTSSVILEDGTMDAERYIEEILPVVLKCGNNRTYQQDGARSHIHSLSQRWCADQFPTFIPKNRWPSNSSDLCSLDYSLWNEVAAGDGLKHDNNKRNIDQ